MSDPQPVERATLRRGLGFAASSFVANALVQLLSSVLTARLYGVRTIGEYALVTAPWFTLIQFSNVSEQIALVRELSVLPARDPRVGRWFFPVLGFSTALTTVVGVVVMGLSAAALRGPIDQPDLVLPALVVLAGYVAIENPSWNMDSVFSAFRAGRELLIARLTQVTSFLVLAIAFRAVSRSVWSLAIATVISFALAFVVRLGFIRRYVARTPMRDVRQGVRELPALLRFAAQLVPGSIANGLSSQAATWVLGAVSTVRVVGAYSRAAGLAIRLQDAGHRMTEMVFPSMVERAHNDDHLGLRDDLRLAIRGAVLPMALIAGVGGGVASGALQVFGDGFADAADAFALLLLAYALSVVSLMIGNAILAQGRPAVTTALVIIRSIVIVGLMVPGAAWYDATGAAAAFCAGFLLDIALRAWIVRRSVAADLGVARTTVAAVVAGAGAFAVARVVDRALVQPVGLLTGAAAGVVAYVALVVVVGGSANRNELVRTVDRVRRRVRRTPDPAPAPPR